MEYLLHQRLSRSAESWPDRIAIEDGERRMRYADLEASANRLANLLLDLGVSRGDRVGLYLDKSLESLVGIYAILKAGAAYVPFDPRAPAARLGYIAGNCGTRVLLTGREKATAWKNLRVHGAPLDALVMLNGDDVPSGDAPEGVDLLTAKDANSRADAPPPIDAIDFDLAYILYTSGSTGNPKGVMLTHLNALTFVDWTVERFGVGSEDRLSNHAPLHFDLTIFDLYAAASAGSAVVLVPPEISVFPTQVRDFIEAKGITIWYSVPSVLSMLTLRGGLKGGEFPSLRTILFAGEVFPTKYLRQLMRLLPNVEFFNLYGPTETNVCTYYEVPQIPEDQTEPIPIGRAIANVEAFAVKDDGTLAAPGEVGELFVRGTTVMQGYWGDPDRTEGALRPSPRGSELRDPAYRTGDLVRQDDNGDYLLLGRRDHQIKSRGYRIELGDIESALYSHPGILECAVIAVPDELITNRIRACVVARDGLARKDLARFLSERIPHYMIPEEIEFLEGLPKTSTGKVDRQALALARS